MLLAVGWSLIRVFAFLRDKGDSQRPRDPGGDSKGKMMLLLAWLGNGE